MQPDDDDETGDLGPYTADERLAGYQMLEEYAGPRPPGPYSLDRPPYDDDEARAAFLFVCAEFGIDIAELGTDRTADALSVLHDLYVFNHASPQEMVSDRFRVMTYDMITGDRDWYGEVQNATWVLRMADPVKRRRAARKLAADGFTPRPAARELAHARLSRTCRCLGRDCRCG